MTVFIRQLCKAVDEIEDGFIIIHQMKIIQHKYKVFVNLIVDFINQCNQHGFHALVQVGQRVEHGARTISEFREMLRNSGDEICNKSLRFPVERIERQPAEGQITTVCQVNQKGRLAITGRRRDHDQFTVKDFVDRV